MDAPLTRGYYAGMPQLAYSGLSENWLLKECGDLHWGGLARAHGLAQPDFRDASGARAYAAFTRVRVSEGALDRIAVNAAYAIESGLAPAGRAQFYSRHLVRGDEGVLARVEMLSAFVFRRARGNNRSVARAALTADERWRPDAASPPEDEAERFADAARGQRRAAREAGGSMATLAPAAGPHGRPLESRHSPCPDGDFNGASFLYFATFAALVDRAEWQGFRPDPLLTVVSRDVHYYGNVNLGEDVAVRCLAWTREADGGLSHRCGIFRAADGMLIAEAVTRKRPARALEAD